MAAKSNIDYASSASGWEDYPQSLTALINRYNVRSVCEMGAGANPSLSPACISTHNLEYTLLDISAEELAKAPDGYTKLQADICDPGLKVPRRFDLVFSKMLLEHVRDGEQLHRNVFEILKPRGLAFHFFPTLYCLPFLANRIMFEAATGRLLGLLAPRDPFRAKKFPAYYSWCRGPSARQIGRLERLGYTVLEYRGFFGHNYYARVTGARGVHRCLARFLVRHPSPHFTSYASMLLRK